jgi:predicted NACHT family NTPase
MSNFHLQRQEVKGNQYNADTIYFRAPLSLSEKQQQNYRGYMIKQVHFSWIDGVLEPSMSERAPIIQGLQMQPGMVVNPFGESVQESHQSPHTLSPQTSIIQVYDRVNGRLLISGEPGAGKTTLLLELARELLDRAQVDETRQLPVVFHLSSWAEKRQSLADWLVEELQRKYCVQKELARESIAANYLLLLLDGLDEVAPSARAACIEAINSYQKEHGPCPMVVCSRKEEYLASRQRVELNNAVMVLPLTQEQIDAYLRSMGEQMEAVRMALQHDVTLHELTTAPLMLNIVTRAYQGRPVEDLLVEETPDTNLRSVVEF